MASFVPARWRARGDDYRRRAAATKHSLEVWDARERTRPWAGDTTQCSSGGTAGSGRQPAAAMRSHPSWGGVQGGVAHAAHEGHDGVWFEQPLGPERRADPAATAEENGGALWWSRMWWPRAAKKHLKTRGALPPQWPRDIHAKDVLRCSNIDPAAAWGEVSTSRPARFGPRLKPLKIFPNLDKLGRPAH